MLLTGQRRSEVLAMRWSEIDDNSSIWSMVGERTKNGKPHRVPLSKTAVRLINSLPRIEDARGKVIDLLFPARGQLTNPASGISKAKSRLDTEMTAVLMEQNANARLSDWHLHDLRRTFVVAIPDVGRVEERSPTIDARERSDTAEEERWCAGLQPRLVGPRSSTRPTKN